MLSSATADVAGISPASGVSRQDTTLLQFPILPTKEPSPCLRLNRRHALRVLLASASHRVLGPRLRDLREAHRSTCEITARWACCSTRTGAAWLIHPLVTARAAFIGFLWSQQLSNLSSSCSYFPVGIWYLILVPSSLGMSPSTSTSVLFRMSVLSCPFSCNPCWDRMSEVVERSSSASYSFRNTWIRLSAYLIRDGISRHSTSCTASSMSWRYLSLIHISEPTRPY